MNINTEREDQRSGFSMVELMFVVVLISVLLALSVNSFFGLGAGLSLTRSGDIVGDSILRARQQAIATSHAVEFRFYDLATIEDDQFVTVIQIARQKDDGTYEAENPVWLPGRAGISRNPNLTSFFQTGDSSKMLIRAVAGQEFPAQMDAGYIAFRYHPDGSTNLSSDKWFLTLMSQGDSLSDGIPTNFYTIQIDPVLGQIQTFRP